jgi:WD40 repeat protein
MPVGPRVPFSITRIVVSADSRDVLLAGATLVVHWRDGHRSDWISTSAPIRTLGFVRDDAWLLVDGEDAGPMGLATDDGLDGLHFDAPVVAAALAGGRLFTVDGDGRLGAFDLAGWEVLASGALAGATGLAASPDGTLVAVVLPDGVALCDSEFALVSRLAVSEVVGVAVGDAHLAVKTRGGFAVFTHAGGPVAAWAAAEVSAFAISPSGTVCGATDGAVTAWRCDGSPAWSAPFDGRPTAVAWCHGSFWVGDRGVGRYAEVDGTGPPTEGPASQVTHLQALGDRKLVSRHGARWWVSGPEGVRSFHYPGASRVQLVDGGFLVSGQQVLARLDAEGTEVTRYAIPAGILCSAAAASPDGGAIAVAGYVGELALLDAGTGSVRWRTVAHAHLVGAVVFSADGRWLSSRTLSDVPRVWSCADGTPASRPACFGQQVVGAGFQGMSSSRCTRTAWSAGGRPPPASSEPRSPRVSIAPCCSRSALVRWPSARGWRARSASWTATARSAPCPVTTGRPWCWRGTAPRCCRAVTTA